MLRRFLLLAISVGALWFFAAPISAQTTCTFATIDVPEAAATLPWGINKYGTVVGTYLDDGTGDAIGFRWSNGSITRYRYTGGIGTEFYGNNDAGDIVGAYEDGSDDRRHHGLVRSGGKYIPFDYPGALDTYARGINKYGSIVGYFFSSNGRYSGFRKRSGGWTVLRYPGAVSTWAYGISNTGLVVGSYTDPSGLSHGFTYQNGVYTKVDFPGADFTEVHGANKYESLVGLYIVNDPPNDHAQGWQRKGGTFKTVNVPGELINSLNGINDMGDEVGANSTEPRNRAVGFLRKCR
jgi:probable HAF family extracellular repeat protein